MPEPKRPMKNPNPNPIPSPNHNRKDLCDGGPLRWRAVPVEVSILPYTILRVIDTD